MNFSKIVLVLIFSAISTVASAVEVTRCTEVGVEASDRNRVLASVEKLDADHYLIRASSLGNYNATLLCAFPPFNEECVGFEYGTTKTEGTIEVTNAKVIGATIGSVNLVCN